MAVGKNIETHSRQRQNSKRSRGKVCIMRPLQKLFSLQMKDNKIRPSSNPQMKKTNETNDELSKQIQEDEKKQDNDANNDELFPRSPKNLKQSDKEPLSHGDENENVTGQLKCNR